MKKVILFAFLAIFSLSAYAIAPDSKSKSENAGTPDRKENKMSEEEVNSITKRIEETGSLNSTKQTIVVQDDHRNGRGHHRENRRNGGVIFIGGGGVLLLVLLIILLA